jgi:hypothetical protein
MNDEKSRRIAWHGGPERNPLGGKIEIEKLCAQSRTTLAPPLSSD